MKKKVYVGCSLTGAPQEFIDTVSKLKDTLRLMGFEVLEFIGLTDGTCEDVAIHDIKRCVRQADFFIAVCDLPSTGLGIELGDAGAKNLPTLAVAHIDAKVTRLVQGYQVINPNFRFIRYADILEDVPAQVREMWPVYVSTPASNGTTG